MKNYQYIIVKNENNIYSIQLHRPEIHNAFDDVLIAELTDAFKNIREDQNARVLIISGEGKSFCAGADLNWMKKMKNYTLEENKEDALRLSQMFQALYELPIPTIARVHGAAIGGGVGLVATCDIVVASPEAFFSLSEVKIGIVPACISPYLVNRIPRGMLRYYFLTGMRMDATRAKEIGLVNDLVALEELDNTINKIVHHIQGCGPHALTMAKQLLHNIPGMKSEEYMAYTADMIATLRISDEGQEGLSSFLEKRKPAWSIHS